MQATSLGLPEVQSSDEPRPRLQRSRSADYIPQASQKPQDDNEQCVKDAIERVRGAYLHLVTKCTACASVAMRVSTAPTRGECGGAVGLHASRMTQLGV